MTRDEKDLLIVAQTVDQIRPLLNGKGAKVQGAILADLLSMWLAGHIVEDDTDQTDELQDRLLRMHIDYVRQLAKLATEVGKR